MITFNLDQWMVLCKVLLALELVDKVEKKGTYSMRENGKLEVTKENHSKLIDTSKWKQGGRNYGKKRGEESDMESRMGKLGSPNLKTVLTWGERERSGAMLCCPSYPGQAVLWAL